MHRNVIVSSVTIWLCLVQYMHWECFKFSRKQEEYGGSTRPFLGRNVSNYWRQIIVFLCFICMWYRMKWTDPYVHLCAMFVVVSHYICLDSDVHWRSKRNHLKARNTRLLINPGLSLSCWSVTSLICVSVLITKISSLFWIKSQWSFLILSKSHVFSTPNRELLCER